MNCWSDLPDRRQSTAERGSPGTAWRYCQKFSPWPARRRPWKPIATEAARCSAWASSGGSAPATFSASRRSPTGPWGLSLPRRRRGSITRRPPVLSMSPTSRPIRSSRVWPSARAAKPSAIRWISTGCASAATSSSPGTRRPWISARARIASISACAARGPGPQLTASRTAAWVSGVPGRAARTRSRMRSSTGSPTGSRRISRCAAIRLSASKTGSATASSMPVVARMISRSDAAVGVAHVDLQQEPVELRLGQRIGALLLDRVLRRQHVERPRQDAALPGDRDLLLLHRLQERRLGARARAVDLVGHQELAEDRAVDEAEGARSVGPGLQHLGAEDVGGHQVGGELHPVRDQAEHRAERLDQPGLGEARRADEQAVAAAQDRDQRLLDHLLLADDAPRDHLARRAPAARRSPRSPASGHRCPSSARPFQSDARRCPRPSTAPVECNLRRSGDNGP